jgi:prophage maintenance system killer protein
MRISINEEGGNKQISISTADLFLQVNGYRLTATSSEREEFAIHVTTVKPSTNTIADWSPPQTVRTKSH